MQEIEINPPVFIIGAGRSGTNILRDVLTSIPQFITWPCDEINPVFRYGNRNKQHDILTSADVNEKARKYIFRTFKKLQKKNSKATIIEKTCANTLRVGFINEIFPDAKFLCIVRDGYDVTHSAMKRWTASVDLAYLFRKLPYVPVVDMPYYFCRFVRNRLTQFNSKQKIQGQWGPRYPNMQQDSKTITSEEVCARQWAICVQESITNLQKLESERAYYLSYERFVKNPAGSIRSICDWLQVDLTNVEITRAVNDVNQTSLGKGTKALQTKGYRTIRHIIDPISLEYYDSLADKI